MKSTPNGAGNLKMKGKKVCDMNCGCCTAINFKEQVNEKFKDEEIEEYEFEKEEEIYDYTLNQSEDPNDLYPQQPWAW